MTRKLGLFIYRVDHDGYEDGLAVVVADTEVAARKLLGEIREKHARRFDDWQSDAWWQLHGDDLISDFDHVAWRLVYSAHNCICDKPQILAMAYHVG